MIDINEIGATAFVIASIRALEPEKSPTLFSDPYAQWFSNERAQSAARQLDAAFPPSTTNPEVAFFEVDQKAVLFDYFSLDMQGRDFEAEADRERIEGVERAMGASFPTGFPDLTVFEKEAPFKVAESGSFAGLAEACGMGDMVAGYPEEWRETLKLYRYCVLERG